MRSRLLPISIIAMATILFGIAGYLFEPVKFIDKPEYHLAWLVLSPLLGLFVTSILMGLYRLLITKKLDQGSLCVINYRPEHIIKAFLKSPSEFLTIDIHVREWILLLCEATRLIKKNGTWFATYIFRPNTWSAFDRFARTYNNSLKNRDDVTKTRSIIQPDRRLKGLDTHELVKDSLDAGVNVHGVPRLKMRRHIKNLGGLLDFALFDGQYVILGTGLKSIRKVKLRDYVSVKMIKGESVGTYLEYEQRTIENAVYHYNEGVK